MYVSRSSSACLSKYRMVAKTGNVLEKACIEHAKKVSIIANNVGKKKKQDRNNAKKYANAII